MARGATAGARETTRQLGKIRERERPVNKERLKEI